MRLPKPVRIGRVLTLALCIVTAMAFVAACGGGSDDKTSDAPTAVPTVAAAASPTEAPTATQAAATVEPTMEHATMSEYPVEQATSATSAATVTAPTTTAAPDSKQVEVQILDFKFEPAVLEVEAGTTVTFINKGVDHTATAKDDPSIFDSGILHTGDSFSVTFDTPGMIDYWCLLHPNMLGMIMVR